MADLLAKAYAGPEAFKRREGDPTDRIIPHYHDPRNDFHLRRRSGTMPRAAFGFFGAKIVSHGRYVAFQVAEVAIPKNLFADIMRIGTAAAA